jgi:hypothetical protein
MKTAAPQIKAASFKAPRACHNLTAKTDDKKMDDKK